LHTLLILILINNVQYDHCLQAVEEKDKQIESLKKKLDEATCALEENAALIEDVRMDMLKC